MKTKWLFPFAFLALIISGCGGGSSSSSTSESSSNTSSWTSDSSTEGLCLVRFYKNFSVGNIEIDYDEDNAEDPYHTKEAYYWYYSEPNVLLEEPTTPTASDDPAFPLFLGWSEKPIINNESDLIDFTTDKVPSREVYTLYGIWVSE